MNRNHEDIGPLSKTGHGTNGSFCIELARGNTTTKEYRENKNLAQQQLNLPARKLTANWGGSTSPGTGDDDDAHQLVWHRIPS